MNLDESGKNLIIKDFDEVYIKVVENPITKEKSFLVRNLFENVPPKYEAISVSEIIIDGIKLVFSQ